MSKRGPNYKPEEDYIIIMMYRDKPWDAILRALPGRHREGIKYRAGALKVTRPRGGSAVGSRHKDPRPGTHEIFRALRSERLARGLSQRAVAKAIGYNPSQLAAWELGLWHPKFQSLIDWVQFFGMILPPPRPKNAPFVEKQLPRLGYTGMNSVRLVGQS